MPSGGATSANGARQIISGKGSPKATSPAAVQNASRSSSWPVSRTLTV